MKKWLSKIIGKLLAVGENRYVHSTIGELIASIVLCIALPFVAWWIEIVIAIVVVTALALVKDYALDSNADALDIIYSMAGAVVVCFPVFICCI